MKSITRQIVLDELPEKGIVSEGKRLNRRWILISLLSSLGVVIVIIYLGAQPSGTWQSQLFNPFIFLLTLTPLIYAFDAAGKVTDRAGQRKLRAFIDQSDIGVSAQETDSSIAHLVHPGFSFRTDMGMAFEYKGHEMTLFQLIVSKKIKPNCQIILNSYTVVCTHLSRVHPHYLLRPTAENYQFLHFPDSHSFQLEGVDFLDYEVLASKIDPARALHVFTTDIMHTILSINQKVAIDINHDNLLVIGGPEYYTRFGLEPLLDMAAHLCAALVSDRK